jgi:WD40 repeat protein/tRNA A-37 threonylcarbamoyl transferase component Bud32
LGTASTRGCLDDETLAAYAAGALAAAERESLGAHLDVCTGCRELVAAVVRLEREARTASAMGDPSTPKETDAVTTRPLAPAPPAPAIAAGTQIDQYRVLRALAAGGMGDVYLARDVELGRKVALKIIRPERLADPRARERFLFEARVTARFDHPHIVTIHSVGQYGDAVYLALAFLDGEDLASRLRARRLSEPEAVRIGLAVAEALEEAHRHGVLHRDLKPSNVVLPTDGRPRVVDFGLAILSRADAAPASSRMLEALTETTSFVGTPAYMAPEQWRDEELGEATDVWGLGMILFETCAGRRPFVEADLVTHCQAVLDPAPAPDVRAFATVSAELAELVARCLAKDVRGRPSASEVARVLRRLARGQGRPVGEASPYRGLASFDERHAELFFGRETEIATFVERLRKTAVVAVVGAAGVGKSSFVRAGVLPRLRESAAWRLVAVRPEARPLFGLATSLLRAATAGGDGEERGDAAPAANEVEALAARLRQSPERLAARLGAIAELCGEPVLLLVDPLEELFTLCVDPEERRAFLLAVTTAADDLDEAVRVVLTLRPDALDRVATEGGARRPLGHVFLLQPPSPSALRAMLVRPLEAAGHAFDDDRLVDELVATVGGEAQSLSLVQLVAERLWESRDREAQRLRRSAFEAMGGVTGALATHGERCLGGLGSGASGSARRLLVRLVTPRRTRAVLPRAELLDGLPAGAAEVLARLTEARLVTAMASAHPAPSYTLAHPSLVTGWPTLARWVEEESARRTRRRLGLGAALVLLGAAALGASALAAWASAKEHEARQARGRAEGERALALFEGAQAAAARRDMLEARAKLRMALEADDSLGARALWWRLARDPLLGRRDLGSTVNQIASSPDGRLLAAATSGRAVVLLDPATLAPRLLRGHRDQVLTVAFAPDGRRLASGSLDGELRLWDAERAEPLWAIRAHEQRIHGLAFQPGGELVATVSGDGTVRLWDAASGAARQSVTAHAGAATAVAFAPDGKRFATVGADGVARIFEAAGTAQGSVLRGQAGPSFAVAFHPRGGVVAAGGADGAVHLWEVERGTALRTLRGHGGEVRALAFDESGRGLASAGADRSVRLWDSDTGEPTGTLGEHEGAVLGVAFLSDGRLASGGVGNVVRLWSLGAAGDHEERAGHEASVYGTSFHPGGAMLASGGFDGVVRLWDVPSGREIAALRGHDEGIYDVAFDPAGRWLASGGVDGTVRLWRVGGGAPTVLAGHRAKIYAVGFSPDGRTLASGDAAGALFLRSLGPQGEPTAVRELASGSGLVGLAFRADGRVLATAHRDKTVRLWDLERDAASRVLGRHADRVFGVSFHPDGKLLASSSADRKVRLWDVETGEVSREIEQPGRAYWLAFHPDGKRLGVAGSDGARIWDLEAGVAIRLVGHAGEVNGFRFSRDGGLAATTSDDRSVRLWDTASGRPVWRGPLLGATPPLAFSHRGWAALDGAAAGAARARPWPAFARAVEERARHVVVAEDRKTACLETFDGAVELFSLGDDRLLASSAAVPVADLAAFDGGCLVLSDGRALVVRSDGTRAALDVEGATAVGAGAAELWVAAAGALFVFDAAGVVRARHPVDPGVTAVARMDAGRLAVGYGDGGVALVGAAGAAPDPGASLELGPASRVTRLHAGPRGTLGAGFADGTVRLWDPATGKELGAARLHGPVRHLAVVGDTLHAATDLGQRLRWDLGLLGRDRCELVREIWRRVPVGWRAGRVELAASPTSHPCAR